MTLQRFLEIWNLELNKENYRYENNYISLDYLFVKDAEERKDLHNLSFELSEMMRPTIKDMD